MAGILAPGRRRGLDGRPASPNSPRPTVCQPDSSLTRRTPVKVDELVAALTLAEKAALVAGADLWSTAPVERLGIPKVRLTDGPNGARGAGLPGDSSMTAVCT